MFACRAAVVVICLASLLGIPAFAQDPNALKEQARAFFKQGDYRQAIAAYQKAEAAASRAFGANSQKTDIIVNELAMSLYKQGDYRAAIPLYERVYKNTVANRGAENYHYDVATCLNNLGLVYDDLGDDVKAEEMYRTAKDLVAGRNPNDPYVAVELNNLAAIYRDRGDFVRALEYYEQSLKLYQRQQPRDDTKIASSLNNMAVTKSSLGQDVEAEKLYREALRLRLATLGPEHPSLAGTMTSLAGLLAQQGKTDEARSYYEQALKIRRAKLGADHLDVAVTLNNFAEFLRKQGANAEAEKLHLESLRIREAKGGPASDSVALSVHNLAGLYCDLDRDQEATALYERSLKINLAKFGGRNPEVVKNLVGSAVLFSKLERWKEAAQAFDESRRIVRQHNAQVLPALKPAEQLAFLKTTERFLESALAAAYLNRDDQAFIDLSAAWLLNSKGVAQQAVSERETLARDKEDPATAETAKSLETARRELARLMAGAGKNDNDAAALAEIARLRAEEQRLVRLLAVTGGLPSQAADWVELKDIRKSLPADGVLIQIGRFRPRDFKAKSSDANRWQPARYAAWLIPATGKGEVRFIDLGPADKIEGAVREARATIEGALAAIQTDGEAAAEEALRGKLQPITDLVLAPCLAQAGDVKSLFLNPDSSLWLVPWAALPLPDKRYAVEKYAISYVVSGRDLLPSEKSNQPPGAPVIFADPDYDLTAANVVAAAKAMWQNNPVPAANLTYRCAVSLGKVQRLSATAQEAAFVAPRLEQFAGKAPVTYTGHSALEVVAKRIRQPRVLVISTHGFFLPEPEVNERDDSESATPRRGKAAENPLLRCGLLFGGCNSPPAPNVEDGVLNGMEIVRIDLRGTELVVLSACQTGLGQVQSGEGVAGLRQAFQLAGARTVLATLWEIPDNDTARLMVEFFGQLADGKDKAAALRAAQLARIEARRERRGAAHPFYWGAFTLTGRP